MMRRTARGCAFADARRRAVCGRAGSAGARFALRPGHMRGATRPCAGNENGGARVGIC